MARARIFRRPKSAMQSGHARTGEWELQWEQATQRTHDPLMGWITSNDTQTQVTSLSFASREDAIAYAEKRGLVYEVELPTERAFKPKAYADNFRYGRSENWTH